MNVDIRLSVEFFDHPKTVKLKRRLGLEGVICLQRLWVWAAQNRANGLLDGLDDEAVEIAAHWDGEDGKFVSTLLELRFIDQGNGAYTLHGWEERQQYASKADERKEKAQKAAAARWNKPHNMPQAELSNASLCYEHATSMPQAQFSNAPEPEPEPKEEKTDANASLSTPAGADAAPAPAPQGSLVPDWQPAKKMPPACPYEKIVALYHERLPEHQAVKAMNTQRRSHLKARWAEIGERLRGQSRDDSEQSRLDWLARFFLRARDAPFLTGRVLRRDNGRPFMADLDFLFSPKGFTGVIEGKYDDQGGAA